jgi:hypothetical protein
MSNVIQLAAFRKPAATIALNSMPATRLELSISGDSVVPRPAPRIGELHSLAVLAWCLELGARCLDMYVVAEAEK